MKISRRTRVKGLGREAANLKNIRHLTNSMYAPATGAAWLSALFLPTVQIISAFAVGGVAWCFLRFANQLAGMSVGSIQAFVSYITFMMWPGTRLARVFAEMQHALHPPETYVFAAGLQPKNHRTGPIQSTPINLHRYRLRPVNFSMKTESQYWKTSTMKVKPGETIALLAHRRRKRRPWSTCCVVSMNDGGRFSLEGGDYTTISAACIPQKIGIVLQNPQPLFGNHPGKTCATGLDATDERLTPLCAWSLRINSLLS